ncbi:acetate--CoA ligase family protein [Streptomyces atratus]|uniref:acetate--CoA ligase family protein n=1 Tax=Streptomyces atratus TaxID=1893 RepID=UPI0033D21538
MTATSLAAIPMVSTPIGDIGQIGILVNDFDAALDRYGRMFGIEEWTCYHYTPEFLRWSRYGDAEGRFEMLLGMGGSSPQVELIQPLASPSIYQDFLDAGHVGLHHLGVFVDDLDEAIARMAEAGYHVTQTARGYGLNGDGGFAYFDTENDLGAVIEAIEVPSVRRPGEVRRTAGAAEPAPAPVVEAGPRAPRIDNPLRAESVAVVGPSRDPWKTSGRTLDYLSRLGFDGRYYAVSPVHDEVLGVPTYPSLSALPEVPDVAVLVGPADRVIEDLRECVAIGVPFAVAFASGFGETGRHDRDEKIRAVLAEGSTRLVGPNCIGFMHVGRSLTATFSSVLQRTPLPAGHVALFSQSGGLGNALMQSLVARGVSGLSAWASSGNEISLGFTDWVGWLTAEEDTHVLASIVESFRPGDDLEAAAAAAGERGVPVAVLKLGRSARGALGAQSHTGKLAGSGRVAQSVLRHRFGTVCTSPEQLLDLAETFDVFAGRLARDDHELTVVTTSGAQAVLWNDLAEDRDLTFRDLGTEAAARIAVAVGSDHVGNPVDVGVQLTTADYVRIVDSVVTTSTGGWVIVTATRLAHDFDELAAGIAAMDVPEGVRVVVVPLSEDDRVTTEQAQVLRAAGAIALPTAARALDAIASAASWAKVQRTRAARGQLVGASLRSAAAAGGTEHLTFREVAEELAAAGVPVPASRAVRDVESVVRAAEEIGFPVAIKIDDPDILHKADAGGVFIGVDSTEAARDAAVRLTAIQSENATISVQTMAPGKTEVLVGLRRDPEFGPVLVLGAGGGMTEAIDDISILPLPTSRPEVRDAIAAVRVVAAGLRKDPGAQTLDALTDAVRDVVAWAEQRGDVHEFEFNPILADPETATVTVVDAVVSVLTLEGTN